MNKKYLIPLLALVLVLIFTICLNAEENFYYGYITYIEKGCKVKREFAPSLEEAVLNFPLIPGDEIFTSKTSRCEIQFDNGTIIRLNKNTELKIETILAQSLTSPRKITTLLLNKGEIYVMNKNYRREIFQFITPNAAIKLKDNSVSKIGVNENGETYFQVIRGKGYIKYGPNERELKTKKVQKSERVLVNLNHQLISQELVKDTDFDLWNEVMNEHFKEIHWGRSKIPDPIYKFPKAVIYFAERYADRYGEWIYTDLFGYVWKPHYSNYYPGGAWMPYRYGRWVLINGELFWVPAEPWGWVPYHFGIWHWTPKWGWIWIPGSTFHYGLVGWFYTGFYIGWRPWTLWDYWFWYDYWINPYYYYWNTWYYYQYRDIPGEEIISSGRKYIRHKISKEELKAPKKKPYSLPKEYKKIIKNLIFKSHELKKTVLHSPSKILNQFVFVKNKDLLSHRLSEKIIPYSKIKKEINISSLNKTLEKQINSSFLVKRTANLQFLNSVVYREEKSQSEYNDSINITLHRTQKSIEIDLKKSKKIKDRKFFDENREARILPRNFPDVLHKITKEKIPFVRKDRSSHIKRFRDWNPDIRWAIKKGVNIVYSSQTNEIICPSLRISSTTISSYGNYSSSSRGGYSSISKSGTHRGSRGDPSRGNTRAGNTNKD